nr:ABC transporter permease [Rathayibacter iranicus]
MQARIELRRRFLRWTAVSFLVPPVVLYLVFRFLDLDLFGGADVVRSVLAGFAAASMFIGGIVGIASELVTEQEDGSVLRAKTLPFGMATYLSGKLIALSVTNFVALVLILISSDLVIGGILPRDPAGWIGLTGLAVLTLACTVPLGATLGSLVSSPFAVLPLSLAAYGLMLISGVFFPVALLPDWIQLCVSFFPVYWLGELARAVLLPGFVLGGGEFALAIVVPLAWGVLGMLLAPRALGAMSRRQSGRRLETIQERRTQRGY